MEEHTMNWSKQSIDNISLESIPHRNWKRALSEAYSLMLASNPGDVICITGPSRGGKTRLISELSNLMSGGELTENGVMPCVTILAENCSVRGSFSTKAFTIRGLEEVQHPIYGINKAGDAWGVTRYALLQKTSEGVLRPALETALKLRKTKYLFIDEAQHIMHAQGSTQGAAAILDSWKCLAQTAGIVLVLVGAYPLLNVLRLSPHLLGRKHQVHLPRYHENRGDIIAFREIVDTYSELIVMPKKVRALNEWSETLYRGSLGCIGLLQSWLRRAIANADANNASALRKEDLFSTRTPRVEFLSILEEIAAGETALELIKDSPAAPINPSSKNSPSTGKKTKPFRKKPRRYPVGGRS